MRLLTKAEACRELAVSLSTLDRRISSGEVHTKREPRGRRHRVYVMLDDDLPSAVEASQSALAAAQERVRGLEEQMALLQSSTNSAGTARRLVAVLETRRMKGRVCDRGLVDRAALTAHYFSKTR